MLHQVEPSGITGSTDTAFADLKTQPSRPVSREPRHAQSCPSLLNSVEENIDEPKDL